MNLPLSVVEFAANNPHIKTAIEGDRLIISRPWGTEDLQLSYAVTDTELVEELRHLLLLPPLDAIHHLDSNESEFIFAFLNPKDPRAAGYMDRAFVFHFAGVSYQCEFRGPSKRLLNIAANYRRLPSDSGKQAVSQLIAFRDFQRQAELPPQAIQFFSERVSRSFFVKPSAPIKEIDWEILSRHLNLLMAYYDRQSPFIVLRPKHETASEPTVEALRYVERSFPKELVLRECDEILLRLIEVARNAPPRFAFIYCFQIFEYAGFYFMDAKTKGAVTRLLRSPSFISCSEERMTELFSLLTDSAQNDDVKIRKAIEEYCDPKILWREIEQHRDFFTSDIEFEGGFSLPKLISKDTTEDSWCSMWTPKLIDQVTKVRNCLVHAREKRESRVILPTSKNDERLSSMLPLVLRMAEQIVLHGDS